MRLSIFRSFQKSERSLPLWQTSPHVSVSPWYSASLRSLVFVYTVLQNQYFRKVAIKNGFSTKKVAKNDHEIEPCKEVSGSYETRPYMVISEPYS